MIKIQLKHSTYTKMLLHCDSALIEAVFNDIKSNGGKVVIDDKNEAIDEWYIDDYLKLETIDISENLRLYMSSIDLEIFIMMKKKFVMRFCVENLNYE